ncbi:hypothetical protein KZP23_02605 [Echinicola marina]|uniref:hypothetical protein n=1 Tax=Echinicola marina TaxID=2859768 RepID=UPI001CF699D1|nr:hypothetical protein [Echinicola marina]UCS93944.1 hypothetical protein KZP23_02605 [Echinicola marina]
MHSFDELIYDGTTHTLKSLQETSMGIFSQLQHSGRTSLVKGLQMINLQKAVLATGMFSIFEADLQRELDCDHGFKEVKKVLLNNGEIELEDRFNKFILAINVLKHGKGKSYDLLVEKSESLPFRIKLPEEYFFF